jgi:hypothetical protein
MTENCRFQASDFHLFSALAAYKNSPIADTGKIENLQTEISALREEVRLLSARLNK